MVVYLNFEYLGPLLLFLDLYEFIYVVSECTNVSLFCFAADILEEFEGQVAPLKVKCECPGGGRIQHKPEEKFIRVYSYSQVSTILRP